MRNLLFVLTAFVLGCSQYNCSNTPTPPVSPPVSIPDAGPPVVDAGSNTQESIEWVTRDALVERLDEGSICVLSYFEHVECDGCNAKMEEAFTDQELVTMVNGAFISYRFPIDIDNAAAVMHDFKLQSLPAVLMSPPNDENVITIEGNVSADELKTVINHYRQSLLADCSN